VNLAGGYPNLIAIICEGYLLFHSENESWGWPARQAGEEDYDLWTDEVPVTLIPGASFFNQRTH